MNPVSHASLMTEIVAVGSEVIMAGFNTIPTEGLIISQEDLFDEDLFNENSVFFNTYHTKINEERHHKTNRTTGDYYIMDNIYSDDCFEAVFYLNIYNFSLFSFLIFSALIYS